MGNNVMDVASLRTPSAEMKISNKSSGDQVPKNDPKKQQPSTLEPAPSVTLYTNVIAWVVTLEAIVSLLPLLVDLLTKKNDEPITFWSHPVSSCMRFLPFFFIIVCSLINVVSGFLKQLPDRIFWPKLTILTMGFTCYALYRAGETRLETLLPIMMVVLLIFTQPISCEKKDLAYIVPVVCLSLIFLYAAAFVGTSQCICKQICNLMVVMLCGCSVALSSTLLIFEAADVNFVQLICHAADVKELSEMDVIYFYTEILFVLILCFVGLVPDY